MDTGRELTDEEERVRRAGLRILARMIAVQILNQRAAAEGAGCQASEECASPAEQAADPRLEEGTSR